MTTRLFSSSCGVVFGHYFNSSSNSPSQQRPHNKGHNKLPHQLRNVTKRNTIGSTWTLFLLTITLFMIIVMMASNSNATTVHERIISSTSTILPSITTTTNTINNNNNNHDNTNYTPTDPDNTLPLPPHSTPSSTPSSSTIKPPMSTTEIETMGANTVIIAVAVVGGVVLVGVGVGVPVAVKKRRAKRAAAGTPDDTEETDLDEISQDGEEKGTKEEKEGDISDADGPLSDPLHTSKHSQNDQPGIELAPLATNDDDNNSTVIVTVNDNTQTTIPQEDDDGTLRIIIPTTPRSPSGVSTLMTPHASSSFVTVDGDMIPPMAKSPSESIKATSETDNTNTTIPPETPLKQPPSPSELPSPLNHGGGYQDTEDLGGDVEDNIKSSGKDHKKRKSIKNHDDAHHPSSPVHVDDVDTFILNDDITSSSTTNSSDSDDDSDDDLSQLRYSIHMNQGKSGIKSSLYSNFETLKTPTSTSHLFPSQLTQFKQSPQLTKRLPRGMREIKTIPGSSINSIGGSSSSSIPIINNNSSNSSTYLPNNTLPNTNNTLQNTSPLQNTNPTMNNNHSRSLTVDLTATQGYYDDNSLHHMNRVLGQSTDDRSGISPDSMSTTSGSQRSHNNFAGLYINGNNGNNGHNSMMMKNDNEKVDPEDIIVDQYLQVFLHLSDADTSNESDANLLTESEDTSDVDKEKSTINKDNSIEDPDLDDHRPTFVGLNALLRGFQVNNHDENSQDEHSSLRDSFLHQSFILRGNDGERMVKPQMLLPTRSNLQNALENTRPGSSNQTTPISPNNTHRINNSNDNNRIFKTKMKPLAQLQTSSLRKLRDRLKMLENSAFYSESLPSPSQIITTPRRDSVLPPQFDPYERMSFLETDQHLQAIKQMQLKKKKLDQLVKNGLNSPVLVDVNNSLEIWGESGYVYQSQFRKQSRQWQRFDTPLYPIPKSSLRSFTQTPYTNDKLDSSLLPPSSKHHPANGQCKEECRWSLLSIYYQYHQAPVNFPQFHPAYTIHNPHLFTMKPPSTLGDTTPIPHIGTNSTILNSGGGSPMMGASNMVMGSGISGVGGNQPQPSSLSSSLSQHNSIKSPSYQRDLQSKFAPQSQTPGPKLRNRAGNGFGVKGFGRFQNGDFSKKSQQYALYGEDHQTVSSTSLSIDSFRPLHPVDVNNNKLHHSNDSNVIVTDHNHGLQLQLPSHHDDLASPSHLGLRLSRNQGSLVQSTSNLLHNISTPTAHHHHHYMNSNGANRGLDVDILGFPGLIPASSTISHTPTPRSQSILSQLPHQSGNTNNATPRNGSGLAINTTYTTDNIPLHRDHPELRMGTPRGMSSSGGATSPRHNNGINLPTPRGGNVGNVNNLSTPTGSTSGGHKLPPLKFELYNPSSPRRSSASSSSHDDFMTPKHSAFNTPLNQNGAKFQFGAFPTVNSNHNIKSDDNIESQLPMTSQSQQQMQIQRNAQLLDTPSQSQQQKNNNVSNHDDKNVKNNKNLLAAFGTPSRTRALVKDHSYSNEEDGSYPDQPRNITTLQDALRNAQKGNKLNGTKQHSNQDSTEYPLNQQPRGRDHYIENTDLSYFDDDEEATNESNWGDRFDGDDNNNNNNNHRPDKSSNNDNSNSTNRDSISYRPSIHYAGGLGTRTSMRTSLNGRMSMVNRGGTSYRDSIILRNAKPSLQPRQTRSPSRSNVNKSNTTHDDPIDEENSTHEDDVNSNTNNSLRSNGVMSIGKSYHNYNHNLNSNGNNALPPPQILLHPSRNELHSNNLRPTSGDTNSSSYSNSRSQVSSQHRSNQSRLEHGSLREHNTSLREHNHNHHNHNNTNNSSSHTGSINNLSINPHQTYRTHSIGGGSHGSRGGWKDYKAAIALRDEIIEFQGKMIVLEQIQEWDDYDGYCSCNDDDDYDGSDDESSITMSPTVGFNVNNDKKEQTNNIPPLASQQSSQQHIPKETVDDTTTTSASINTLTGLNLKCSECSKPLTMNQQPYPLTPSNQKCHKCLIKIPFYSPRHPDYQYHAQILHYSYLIQVATQHAMFTTTQSQTKNLIITPRGSKLLPSDQSPQNSSITNTYTFNESSPRSLNLGPPNGNGNSKPAMSLGSQYNGQRAAPWSSNFGSPTPRQKGNILSPTPLLPLSPSVEHASSLNNNKPLLKFKQSSRNPTTPTQLQNYNQLQTSTSAIHRFPTLLSHLPPTYPPLVFETNDRYQYYNSINPSPNNSTSTGSSNCKPLLSPSNNNMPSQSGSYGPFFTPLGSLSQASSHNGSEFSRFNNIPQHNQNNNHNNLKLTIDHYTHGMDKSDPKFKQKIASWRNYAQDIDNLLEQRYRDVERRQYEQDVDKHSSFIGEGPLLPTSEDRTLSNSYQNEVNKYTITNLPLGSNTPTSLSSHPVRGGNLFSHLASDSEDTISSLHSTKKASDVPNKSHNTNIWNIFNVYNRWARERGADDEDINANRPEPIQEGAENLNDSMNSGTMIPLGSNLRDSRVYMKNDIASIQMNKLTNDELVDDILRRSSQVLHTTPLKRSNLSKVGQDNKGRTSINHSAWKIYDGSDNSSDEDIAYKTGHIDKDQGHFGNRHSRLLRQSGLRQSGLRQSGLGQSGLGRGSFLAGQQLGAGDLTTPRKSQKRSFKGLLSPNKEMSSSDSDDIDLVVVSPLHVALARNQSPNVDLKSPRRGGPTPTVLKVETPRNGTANNPFPLLSPASSQHQNSTKLNNSQTDRQTAPRRSQPNVVLYGMDPASQTEDNTVTYKPVSPRADDVIVVSGRLDKNIPPAADHTQRRRGSIFNRWFNKDKDGKHSKKTDGDTTDAPSVTTAKSNAGGQTPVVVSINAPKLHTMIGLNNPGGQSGNAFGRSLSFAGSHGMVGNFTSKSGGMVPFNGQKPQLNIYFLPWVYIPHHVFTKAQFFSNEQLVALSSVFGYKTTMCRDVNNPNVHWPRILLPPYIYAWLIQLVNQQQSNINQQYSGTEMQLFSTKQAPAALQSLLSTGIFSANAVLHHLAQQTTNAGNNASTASPTTPQLTPLQGPQTNHISFSTSLSNLNNNNNNRFTTSLNNFNLDNHHGFQNSTSFMPNNNNNTTFNISSNGTTGIGVSMLGNQSYFFNQQTRPTGYSLSNSMSGLGTNQNSDFMSLGFNGTNGANLNSLTNALQALLNGDIKFPKFDTKKQQLPYFYFNPYVETHLFDYIYPRLPAELIINTPQVTPPPFSHLTVHSNQSGSHNEKGNNNSSSTNNQQPHARRRGSIQELIGFVSKDKNKDKQIVTASNTVTNITATLPNYENSSESTHFGDLAETINNNSSSNLRPTESHHSYRLSSQLTAPNNRLSSEASNSFNGGNLALAADIAAFHQQEAINLQKMYPDDPVAQFMFEKHRIIDPNPITHEEEEYLRLNLLLPNFAMTQHYNQMNKSAHRRQLHNHFNPSTNTFRSPVFGTNGNHNHRRGSFALSQHSMGSNYTPSTTPVLGPTLHIKGGSINGSATPGYNTNNITAINLNNTPTPGQLNSPQIFPPNVNRTTTYLMEPNHPNGSQGAVANAPIGLHDSTTDFGETLSPTHNVSSRARSKSREAILVSNTAMGLFDLGPSSTRQRAMSRGALIAPMTGGSQSGSHTPVVFSNTQLILNGSNNSNVKHLRQSSQGSVVLPKISLLTPQLHQSQNSSGLNTPNPGTPNDLQHSGSNLLLTPLLQQNSMLSQHSSFTPQLQSPPPLSNLLHTLPHGLNTPSLLQAHSSDRNSANPLPITPNVPGSIGLAAKKYNSTQDHTSPIQLSPHAEVDTGSMTDFHGSELNSPVFSNHNQGNNMGVGQYSAYNYYTINHNQQQQQQQQQQSPNSSLPFSSRTLYHPRETLVMQYSNNNHIPIPNTPSPSYSGYYIPNATGYKNPPTLTSSNYSVFAQGDGVVYGPLPRHVAPRFTSIDQCGKTAVFTPGLGSATINNNNGRKSGPISNGDHEQQPSSPLTLHTSSLIQFNPTYLSEDLLFNGHLQYGNYEYGPVETPFIDASHPLAVYFNRPQVDRQLRILTSSPHIPSIFSLPTALTASQSNTPLVRVGLTDGASTSTATSTIKSHEKPMTLQQVRQHVLNQITFAPLPNNPTAQDLHNAAVYNSIYNNPRFKSRYGQVSDISPYTLHRINNNVDGLIDNGGYPTWFIDQDNPSAQKRPPVQPCSAIRHVNMRTFTDYCHWSHFRRFKRVKTKAVYYPFELRPHELIQRISNGFLLQTHMDEQYIGRASLYSTQVLLLVAEYLEHLQRKRNVVSGSLGAGSNANTRNDSQPDDLVPTPVQVQRPGVIFGRRRSVATVPLNKKTSNPDHPPGRDLIAEQFAHLPELNISTQVLADTSISAARKVKLNKNMRQYQTIKKFMHYDNQRALFGLQSDFDDSGNSTDQANPTRNILLTAGPNGQQPLQKTFQNNSTEGHLSLDDSSDHYHPKPNTKTAAILSKPNYNNVPQTGRLHDVVESHQEEISRSANNYLHQIEPLHFETKQSDDDGEECGVITVGYGNNPVPGHKNGHHNNINNNRKNSIHYIDDEGSDFLAPLNKNRPVVDDYAGNLIPQGRFTNTQGDDEDGLGMIDDIAKFRRLAEQERAFRGFDDDDF